MNTVVRDELHLEPLLAIAREELGISTLIEEGKASTDIRLIRIASLASALKRAYDFGLLMGHHVARAERSRPTWSKLNCRAQQELVRSAAEDLLGATWPRAIRS